MKLARLDNILDLLTSRPTCAWNVELKGTKLCQVPPSRVCCGASPLGAISPGWGQGQAGRKQLRPDTSCAALSALGLTATAGIAVLIWWVSQSTGEYSTLEQNGLEPSLCVDLKKKKLIFELKTAVI